MAVLPGRAGSSHMSDIVAISLGSLGFAAWLVAVAFASVALWDRDGPPRLAWLALLIARCSVSGVYLLGMLQERTRGY